MTNAQRSRRQVRLSRALGIALTPKAQRLFEKRPYAPGEHGRTRRRKGIGSLPGSLHEAVAELKKDRLILDALGEHVAAAYIEGKEREWDEYRTSVSDWEVRKYITQY